MKDGWTPEMQARARVLHQYTQALEQGDGEKLAAVLAEAEQDQALERMILETNESYQLEDAPDFQAAEAERELVVAGSMSAKSTKGGEPIQLPMGRQVARRSTRLRWIATATVGLVAILVLSGFTGLTDQFLSLFRVQNFQTVTVNPQAIKTLQASTLPSLSDFGTLSSPNGDPKILEHLTQAQAQKLINFPLQLPSALPGSFSGAKPSFNGINATTTDFTFSAAKAQAYLKSSGAKGVQVPAKLDGATYSVKTSGVVEMHYLDAHGNILLFVQTASVEIRATRGASLEDLRTFLLSWPGLPKDLVAELKKIDLNSGTLPLPILPQISSKAVTVHGAQGVLLTNGVHTGIASLPIGSAVLWQAHGIIYVVAGTGHDSSTLLAAANSLR